MTSAEKILASIIEEAEKKASEIKQNAENDAQKIIDEANAQAKNLQIEAEAKTNKLLDVIKTTGDSAAALILRDEALKIKRELIENVLKEAFLRLEQLDDNDYFEFLAQKAVNSGLKSGEMMLGEKDLKKNTAVLEEKIQKYGFTLSRTAADIKNGFILKSGDIEINACFDALFREKQSELVDAVNQILFKN